MRVLGAKLGVTVQLKRSAAPRDIVRPQMEMEAATDGVWTNNTSAVTEDIGGYKIPEGMNVSPLRHTTMIYAARFSRCRKFNTKHCSRV